MVPNFLMQSYKERGVWESIYLVGRVKFEQKFTAPDVAEESRGVNGLSMGSKAIPVAMTQTDESCTEELRISL